MRTEFDEVNKAFTDRAHEAAKEQVYPHLFKNSDVELSVESVAKENDSASKALDLSYGIDVVVTADIPELGACIPVYVQERFRRPKWRDEKDITVTKHNNASGEPSELTKIAAQQFIYGYYEPTLDEVQEAICVNVPVLLRQIADGMVSWGEKQNPKEQDFVTIDFSTLHEEGAAAFHLDRTESQKRPVCVDRRQDITAYQAQSERGADDD